MLNCIVSSLERGASKEPLFEFTPEFYMEAAINAFHGLRHYFHPTTNFDDIPGTWRCLLLECVVVVVVFYYFWGGVVLLVIILSLKTGKSCLISVRLSVELTPKVQIACVAWWVFRDVGTLKKWRSRDNELSRGAWERETTERDNCTDGRHFLVRPVWWCTGHSRWIRRLTRQSLITAQTFGAETAK